MKTIGISFLLSLSTCFSIFSSAAEKAKPNLNAVKIQVKDVGTAQFVQTDVGEPIVEPESLEIMFTCLKSKQAKRIKLYRMCNVESYNYEAGLKTVHLKLAAGRVNDAGNVVCDQIDDFDIDFSAVCIK